MRKWHNIIITRDSGNVELSTSLPGSPFEVAVTATPKPTTKSEAANSQTPFNSEKYNQNYVDWIIADNITFRQACSLRLRKLLTAPHLAATLAGTISEWVLKALPERRLAIKGLLRESISKVNISSDLWTGGNKRNYVGVVAHWITAEGNLSTALIGLPRLIGSHTGSNVARLIVDVIIKYHIEENIGAFMMDNAKDNDKLMETIATIFPTIDPKWARLRCAGYIINLIVQAALFSKGVSKL